MYTYSVLIIVIYIYIYRLMIHTNSIRILSQCSECTDRRTCIAVPSCISVIALHMRHLMKIAGILHSMRAMLDISAALIKVAIPCEIKLEIKLET